MFWRRKKPAPENGGRPPIPGVSELEQAIARELFPRMGGTRIEKLCDVQRAIDNMKRHISSHDDWLETRP